MALLNAAGHHVATTMHAVQIEIPIPTEPVASFKMPTFGDIVLVAYQFFVAYQSGDSIKIAAAIEAAIKLFF